ncbi:MAG: hypothetical protein ABF274_10680 [Nonlabens sp.]|jgi:hypothetical protein|uniref:hypothetical protein n=1 Tax=Nonlabens sp. TaxID=1888209 RepID=UPI0032198A1A
MRTTIFLLLISVFIISCDNHQKDFSDLESIAFYDFKGNEVDMEQLKKDWNETMNPVLVDDVFYEQKVKEISIKTLRDNSSNEDYLVLVANTTKKNAFTGKVISSFKDGFQLSDKTVICTNCGPEFQGQLVDGEWICANNGESIDDCMKTSTLDY